MAFVAIGYAPRQVEVKRATDEAILVADARLSLAANPLNVVQVVARNRAARNDTTPDIGGTQRAADNAALTADQRGDLAATVASIPGMTYLAGSNGDPSGFSVLGLTPDQNISTLNGMTSSAANLPRNACTFVSVATSPYDVTRGGASGGSAREGAREVAAGRCD